MVKSKTGAKKRRLTSNEYNQLEQFRFQLKSVLISLESLLFNLLLFILKFQTNFYRKIFEKRNYFIKVHI